MLVGYHFSSTLNVVNIVCHIINEEFHTKNIGVEAVGANSHSITSGVQETNNDIYFKSCFFSSNKHMSCRASHPSLSKGTKIAS